MHSDYCYIIISSIYVYSIYDILYNESEQMNIYLGGNSNIRVMLLTYFNKR